MSESPSERLVWERIRNRIIENLELASSFDLQARYSRSVPIADVPAEVIEGWSDVVWEDPPTRDGFPDVFSDEEVEAMCAYAEAWRQATAALPAGAADLSEVQRRKEWASLGAVAVEVLRVFEVRGRFPEDQEA